MDDACIEQTTRESPTFRSNANTMSDIHSGASISDLDTFDSVNKGDCIFDNFIIECDGYTEEQSIEVEKG